jgi:hypothetical protein
MPTIAGKHQFQRRYRQGALEQIVKQIRRRLAHLRFHIVRNRPKAGLERDQNGFDLSFG